MVTNKDIDLIILELLSDLLTMLGIGDSKKTNHLVGLDGAEERLHLFKANLMEEGSFDTAINGCDGVFHTASPTILSATDPQVNICSYD